MLVKVQPGATQQLALGVSEKSIKMDLPLGRTWARKILCYGDRKATNADEMSELLNL